MNCDCVGGYHIIGTKWINQKACLMTVKYVTGFLKIKAEPLTRCEKGAAAVRYPTVISHNGILCLALRGS